MIKIFEEVLYNNYSVISKQETPRWIKYKLHDLNDVYLLYDPREYLKFNLVNNKSRFFTITEANISLITDDNIYELLYN